MFMLEEKFRRCSEARSLESQRWVVDKAEPAFSSDFKLGATSYTLRSRFPPSSPLPHSLAGVTLSLIMK